MVFSRYVIGLVMFQCIILVCYVLSHSFIIRRRSVLEKKLASAHVSEEEQMNLLKDLERKETEYMRLKRHRICANDFDLLTIIGRGAFGEVRDMHLSDEMRMLI